MAANSSAARWTHGRTRTTSGSSSFGRGKPVENAFIESFNGRLRDECLNAHVFVSPVEAQCVLDAWRYDYNHVRPHSALQDRTPVEMGALWVDSRDARESTAARKDRIETEIAGRFVTISPY